MKFGYRYMWFVWPGREQHPVWKNLRAAATGAEADGFSSFWLNDHFYNLPVHTGDPHDPFFDVWTVLPALAVETSSIRLGPLVSPVGYRNPALLARMAATLDVISGGRLHLGFGAGGYQAEYTAYGFDFPERPATRIEQMVEAVYLMKKMWSEPQATFQGMYFRVEQAILEPKPVQKPHPPILIGGVGEKYLLRAVAEVGDGCNLFGPPDEFRRVRRILQGYCDELNREASEIEMTTYDVVLCARSDSELAAKKARLSFGEEPWKTMVGTPSQLVELTAAYQEAGAEHLLLEFHANDIESYELFAGEVMPHFR
ncbi:MAG: LLM class flavin-dependent oxidoreductase [Anaerolineales bacterium]|nr:LLM class flavin-dependent oxidoreductase [Anaerolineales bacterium]